MSNKLLATIGVVGALVTACPDTNITDSGVDGRTVDGQQDMDTGAGGQPEAGNDALPDLTPQYCMMQVNQIRGHSGLIWRK